MILNLFWLWEKREREREQVEELRRGGGGEGEMKERGCLIAVQGGLRLLLETKVRDLKV